MKLYCKLRLVLGVTAAFGWFILRDISYLAVLPIIPLGVIYYGVARMHNLKPIWLDGFFAFLTAVIATVVVGEGVFDGAGYISLFFLLAAIGVGAIGISKTELSRISGWWIAAFLLVYFLMIVATLPGIHRRNELPSPGPWPDVLIFYLLAFFEPFSLGREYRAAPIILGILLIPFGTVAYLALGNGAFEMAEFPYLSVWSGVAVSAFHHLEGIILCFYYGTAALRIAHFFAEIKKIRCIHLEDMI